ncbi:MAG: tail fiber domain-containing protein [Candidatus Nanohaloarchaea archaeon]|nr:tail fiber domain-containing protein [Candidatus Nanohaloarchaea archaeon]
MLLETERRPLKISIILSILALTAGVAAAAPHHPLSQIYPMDVDLNLSGQDINEIGDLGLAGGSTTIDGSLDVMGPINLSGNEIVDYVTDARSGAPTSPKAGQMWFDTGQSVLKYYNGTNWIVTASTDQVSSDLQSVLGSGNSAGSYNINMSGQRLINIGSAKSSFGSTGNLRMPVNSSGGFTEGTAQVIFSDTASSETLVWRREAHVNRAFSVDRNGNDLFMIADSGTVTIPNGALSMQTNDIKWDSGTLNMQNGGFDAQVSGSDGFTFYDSNGNPVFDINNNGVVGVPKGRLDVTGGSIDANGNYLRSAFINPSGANAHANFIGQLDNAFYRADRKWTCSGDCNSAMFNGRMNSNANWGNSSTPIQFSITFNSAQHYWSAFRIHFNWGRWTDTFTIERRDDSDTDGSCSDESGWSTLESVSSHSGYEYTTTNTGGSWACGFRFTFQRKNSNLNYNGDFRIGGVMAYRYYRGHNGMYLSRNGDSMYGGLNMNQNTLTNVKDIEVNSGNDPITIGPNSNYGEKLWVGGWGTSTSEAWVRTSNGNLHLDGQTNDGVYLNHYSSGNIYLANGGGFVENYGLLDQNGNDIRGAGDIYDFETLNFNNNELSSYDQRCDDTGSGTSGHGLFWFDRSDGGDPTLFLCGQGSTWEINSASASSIEFKDNVSDFSPAADKVLDLNPVSFKWKNRTRWQDRRDIGLIAERVAKKLPKLVTFRNGSAFGVRYDRLGVYLLEVAKRQQQTIDKLQQENKELERKVDRLEAAFCEENPDNDYCDDNS